ncbi:MAG: hypothetical protein ACRCYQ_17125, partial [Nocardioides sp.]
MSRGVEDKPQRKREAIRGRVARRATRPWFVGRRGLVIAVVVAAVGGALLSRQLLSSASDQADTPVCLATPATLVTS